MLRCDARTFPRFIFSLTAFVGAVALAGAAWLAPAAEAEDAAADQAADGAGRTVLVTGANRGLGLEFATQYRAAGWSVIATARDPDAAADLKALGEGVRIVQLDVTSADSVAAMVRALDSQPIDLLINNAGVSAGGERSAGLEQVKLEDFEHVMQVNTLGPVRVTQALLPNLRAGNGKTIVGISSGLGSIAGNERGGYYGYRESKAALGMFTRNIAAELKGEGFICIAMSPGWVRTDMGGPNAPLTPEQSIAGMRKVIGALKPEDTGTFRNYDGASVPW